MALKCAQVGVVAGEPWQAELRAAHPHDLVPAVADLDLEEEVEVEESPATLVLRPGWA